jgi:hypothetical protein
LGDRYVFEALNPPGQELRNLIEPCGSQIFTLTQVTVQQFATIAAISLPVLPTSLNSLLAGSEFTLATLKRESGRFS